MSLTSLTCIHTDVGGGSYLPLFVLPLFVHKKNIHTGGVGGGGMEGLTADGDGCWTTVLSEAA